MGAAFRGRRSQVVRLTHFEAGAAAAPFNLPTVYVQQKYIKDVCSIACDRSRCSWPRQAGANIQIFEWAPNSYGHKLWVKCVPNTANWLHLQLSTHLRTRNRMPASSTRSCCSLLPMLQVFVVACLLAIPAESASDHASVLMSFACRPSSAAIPQPPAGSWPYDYLCLHVILGGVFSLLGS